MQIVDNFILPAVVRQRSAENGSKYFPLAVKKLCEQVEVGQGFVIPLLDFLEKTDDVVERVNSILLADGTTEQKNVYKKGPKHMFSNIKWYVNRCFKNTEKEFAMGTMSDGGVGIKRVK